MRMGGWCTRRLGGSVPGYGCSGGRCVRDVSGDGVVSPVGIYQTFVMRNAFFMRLPVVAECHNFALRMSNQFNS